MVTAICLIGLMITNLILAFHCESLRKELDNLKSYIQAVELYVHED